MSDPLPARPSPATIKGLMVDVAIAGVMFAAFSRRLDPLGVTVGAFALFYFILKVSYLLTDRPARRLRQRCLEQIREGRDEDAEQTAEDLLDFRPHNLDGKYLLGMSYLGQGLAEEARSLLLEVLDDRRLNPKIRPNLWNNIAWADFLIDDPGLMDEADHFSAECLRARPDPAPHKGTRGAVLVWIGRHDEGLTLLEQAFAENTSTRNRALNLCSIALAEAGRGDLEAASQALAGARKIDPKCSLLPRAGRAIADQS